MRRTLGLLFWPLLALDVALLGLWLTLGLAAAKPSHTPLPQLLTFFALPTLVLTLALLLYLRDPWPAARVVATTLVGLPAILVLGSALLSRGLAGFMGMSSDDWGRPDPVVQQAVESAIRSGDVAAVARVASNPQARLNDGAALVVALRQLERQPRDLEPLRALLQLGVRPNHFGGPTDPLAEGIRISRWAGPQPVQMLLDAGADPNQRQTSQPAWFAALSPHADAAVLPLLLARGADLQAVDMAGNNAVYWAAYHRNWTAAATLVERGASWRSLQTHEGQSFKAVVEAGRRRQPEDPALTRLARLLR